jgi:hypothetical protein
VSIEWKQTNIIFSFAMADEPGSAQASRIAVNLGSQINAA